LVRASIAVCVTGLYQFAVRDSLFLTGDEPHYLMTVRSLVADGDFDETNDYAGGTRLVGAPDTPPQRRLPDGRVLPQHGLGFPTLLALPALVVGFVGLPYVLLAVAVAASLLLCVAADRIHPSPRDATLVGSMLVLLPAWQIFGPRIYPEVTAGTIAIAAYALITTPSPSVWAARLAGVMIGYFPLLYLRFAPFAVFLGAIALLNPYLRRSTPFLYALGSTLLTGALVTLLVYGTDWRLAAPGSGVLTIDGSWERFWRLWFDRGHGIAPANPIVLLVFWAVPDLGVRALRQRELRPIALLGSMLLVYTCQFALVPTSSGESPPGRFGCAIAPPALLVISAWVVAAGRGVTPRAVAAGALAFVSIAVIAVGIWSGTPAWLALPSYQDAFPVGWPLPSFSAAARAPQGQSAPLGSALLITWAFTVVLGWTSARLKPLNLERPR
jgi:hypothetical protein